jgi:inosose dehydratase
MTSERNSQSWSRRAFLQHSLLGVAGIAALPRSALAGRRGGEAPPYGPFQMGVQSYSLRAFKTEEALAKTKALGLKFWEAFPQHFPITDDPKRINEYKEQLRAHDIRMLTYGVVDFRNDEKDARRTFTFAKAMGIQTLSAYPQPDALNLLDKLVDEYKINIAIHNHGPGDDLYDKIEKEAAALQGHHERIGACEDTGHRLRSGENPVEAVTKFGKRVYGVHLKDVKDGPNGEKLFTEIGKGKLDTIGLLSVLRANKFHGVLSLEYEEHEQDPIPYMEQCLAVTRFAVRKITEPPKSKSTSGS